MEGEIEPIFRHLELFMKLRNIGTDDTLLIFATVKETLPDSFRWVKARAEEFNVLIFDVTNIERMLKVSEFVQD